jgi:transcriptional regulator with XRE-family HTH domain
VDPGVKELAAWAAAYHALTAVSGPERRRVREAAGITRARLGELLGVSAARVEAYERGTLPAGADALAYHQALEAMAPPEDARLGPEQRAVVLEYFEKDEVCPNCHGIHTRACPRVRSVEYHDGGQLKRVEYWPEGQWSTEYVIFKDGPELA